MISTAMDGLTRRRGARIEREQQQQQVRRATGGQPLSDTVLPIPMVAVAMSGAIFVAATMFMVWYHVFYDVDDEDEDY